MKKIFRYAVVVLLLAIAACGNEETTPRPVARPAFELLDVQPGSTRAVLAAYVRIEEGVSAEEIGFSYQISGGKYVDVVCSDFRDHLARQELTGLVPDTEYRWYCYAVVGGERFNASLSRTFRTLAEGEEPGPAVPQFGEPVVSDLSAGGASLSCVYYYDGASGGVTAAGFGYRAVSQEDYTEVSSVSVESPLACVLEELTADTSYDFYAYVVAGGERYLSRVARFTTPKEEPAPADPRFGHPSVRDVSASSATLACAFSYEGAAAEVGFAYKEAEATEWERVECTSPAAGEKSVTVGGLRASTAYVFYCYAVVDGRTFRSEEAAFVTSGDVPPPAGGVYRTGWAELPVEVEKQGDYYYAYHMRPDGEPGRNYSVCYSADMRCAVWTAMPLHKSFLGEAKRTNAWQYDPVIPRSVQPNLGDSYGGNYSRGHMVASSDRQVNQTINRTTFYYTNMAPQIQNEFNGGIWNDLEGKCQGEWICSDTLYVVTGSYFENSNRTCTDNDGKRVIVPTHFYKVLLRSKSGRTGRPLSQLSADELICTGFWLEHSTKYGTKGKISAQYMMSVSEIEAKTGFRFFTNVPNAPKGSYSSRDWGL